MKFYEYIQPMIYCIKKIIPEYVHISENVITILEKMRRFKIPSLLEFVYLHMISHLGWQQCIENVIERIFWE